MAKDYVQIVGTGITKRRKPRRRLEANNPADMSELVSAFRRLNERRLSTWGGNEAILDAARTRLGEIKVATPSPREDLDAYNAVFLERVTEGWYLQEIDLERAIAETAIGEDRPTEAVQCARRIGELLTEVRFKELWEPALIPGAKVLEGARLGGHIRAAAVATRHAAIRADYAERLERLADDQRAKNATAKAFDITRRQLNRILSK